MCVPEICVCFVDTMVNVKVAYGGTSVRHQMNDLARGCSVLVATPGRLNQFIKEGVVRVSLVFFT